LDVKATVACTHKYTVRTAWVASKIAGQKERNEYCSPEIEGPSEAVEGSIVKRRPGKQAGKTKVSREETVKSTSKATGIRVLACDERLWR
jgi:hypothetical protein